VSVRCPPLLGSSGSGGGGPVYGACGGAGGIALLGRGGVSPPRGGSLCRFSARHCLVRPAPGVEVRFMGPAAGVGGIMGEAKGVCVKSGRKEWKKSTEEKTWKKSAQCLQSLQDSTKGICARARTPSSYAPTTSTSPRLIIINTRVFYPIPWFRKPRSPQIRV
jgi:hypothetical protein